MGRPTQYSTEITTRCQRLIERFVADVEAEPTLAEEFRGPLRTTFLLAMSTPMIVLPMERLYKPFSGRPGVADDTHLDAAVEARVRTIFEGTQFGMTPIFRGGDWSCVDARAYFPVAGHWPSEAFDELDCPEAFEAAAAAPAKDVMSCLRNALSHGGVAYLDRGGRQTEDATNMLAFASYPGHRRTNELRLLRITVDGYQEFLRLWIMWLTESGVEKVLTDQGPGWFDKSKAA
jgi:hypothetical protein